VRRVRARVDWGPKGRASPQAVAPCPAVQATTTTPGLAHRRRAPQ
jgi:hypothetical protein